MVPLTLFFKLCFPNIQAMCEKERKKLVLNHVNYFPITIQSIIYHVNKSLTEFCL